MSEKLSLSQKLAKPEQYLVSFWRCPDRLFLTFSYAAGDQGHPVIGIIDVVQWVFWTLHLFRQTSDSILQLSAFCVGKTNNK